MRTIKRQVEPLATASMFALRALVDAANREKACWLGQMRGYKGFGLLANVRRTVRDPAVKAGCVLPYGLSVRQWKSALDEAVGMAERFWQTHFVGVRSFLAKSTCTDAQPTSSCSLSSRWT